MIPTPAIVIIVLGVLICVYFIIRMWADVNKTDLTEMESIKIRSEKMTNEQAIETLVNARYADDLQGNEDLTTARYMAIEALKTHPKWIPVEEMSQNIARRALQDLRDNGVFVNRWIPVSEGLPESDEEYHTFLVTDSKGRVTLSEFYLSVSDKKPYWSGMIDVIAWMPLPKPYEPQERRGF